MRRTSLIIAAALAIAPTAPLFAQNAELPAGFAPGTAIGYGAPGTAFTAVTPANPLPVAGKQEAFTLISANAPSAAITAYGGDYVFAQACSGYGSVTLRVRGPDGATMQPLVTKTAADPAGATGLALGAGAMLDATVSGTTGCNATLSRLP